MQLSIANLEEVWPGARMETDPVREILLRARSTAVISAESHVPAQRKAVLVLNKETLAPLRQKQGKIYYGFDSVRLRIYDKKGSATSSKTQEDPTGKGAKTTSDNTEKM